MITDSKQRQGLTEILQKKSSDDLISLVINVTSQMLKNIDFNEAISIILNYSEDALSLLKKKKILKENLFNYLNDHKIYVNPLKSKKDFILECLKYWEVESKTLENISFDEHMEDEQTQFFEITNPQLTATQQFVDPIHKNIDNILSIQTQNSTLQNFASSSNYQFIDDELVRLSLKFGEYFYSILPFINDENVFSVNNFWHDANLKLIARCGDRNICLSEIGQHSIIDCLKRLNLNGRIQFRPNLLPQYNGIQSSMENHGLLKIIISGTIYFDNNPLGIFDHFFGLISDSSIHDSNWRIKFFEIMLKLNFIPPIDLDIFKK